MTETNTALERVRDELQNTGVISERFKTHINGWVNAAVSWAYNAGYEEGRKREGRELRALLPDPEDVPQWGGPDWRKAVKRARAMTYVGMSE